MWVMESRSLVEEPGSCGICSRVERHSPTWQKPRQQRGKPRLEPLSLWLVHRGANFHALEARIVSWLFSLP